jgi:hypothetical protein
VTEPAPTRRRLDPTPLVAAGVAVGVVRASMHHPRSGVLVVAGSLAAAALLRLLLSPRAAGSLVVRNRRIDVTVLATLAAALTVLALVTPFRSVA